MLRGHFTAFPMLASEHWHWVQIISGRMIQYQQKSLRYWACILDKQLKKTLPSWHKSLLKTEHDSRSCWKTRQRTVWDSCTKHNSSHLQKIIGIADVWIKYIHTILTTATAVQWVNNTTPSKAPHSPGIMWLYFSGQHHFHNWSQSHTWNFLKSSPLGLLRINISGDLLCASKKIKQLLLLTPVLPWWHWRTCCSVQ